MKIVKRFFLDLAVVIVVLHSITPHSHVSLATTTISSTSCQQVKAESTLISLLQGIFEQDLGVEHLEHFAHQMQDDTPLDVFVSTESIVIPGRTDEIHHAQTPDLYNALYAGPSHLDSQTLRGPPSA